MPITLIPKQIITLALEVSDSDGGLVPLSNPVWASDNLNLITVLPLAEEPLPFVRGNQIPAPSCRALVQSVGSEGLTTVSCRALMGQVPVLGVMVIVVSAGGTLITDLVRRTILPPAGLKATVLFTSVTTQPPPPVPEGVTFMADMQAGSTKTFGVSIVDSFGNAAEIQGGSWDAGPPELLTVTASDPAAKQTKPSPSGAKAAKPKDVNTPYFCTVQSSGKMGSAFVSFRADADLGEGVKPIIGTAAINVLAGEAVGIEIEEVSTPSPEPPNPEPVPGQSRQPRK